MHNLRCEHSTSDPKRCRCQCKGGKHGIQQSAETGTYTDEQAPGQLRTFTAAELMEFDERTLDALEEVSA